MAWLTNGDLRKPKRVPHLGEIRYPCVFYRVSRGMWKVQSWHITELTKDGVTIVGQ